MITESDVILVEEHPYPYFGMDGRQAGQSKGVKVCFRKELDIFPCIAHDVNDAIAWINKESKLG